MISQQKRHRVLQVRRSAHFRPFSIPLACSLADLLSLAQNTQKATRGGTEVDQQSSRYLCVCMSRSIGIMLWLRLLMIHTDPTISTNTMKTPNISAITLFTLSGLVVM